MGEEKRRQITRRAVDPDTMENRKRNFLETSVAQDFPTFFNRPLFNLPTTILARQSYLLLIPAYTDLRKIHRIINRIIFISCVYTREYFFSFVRQKVVSFLPLFAIPRGSFFFYNLGLYEVSFVRVSRVQRLECIVDRILT